ncbi:hypothetical protein [Streptomyces sp. NPDC046197]|uniref:hypothetical protein n=1 Tax=Streptomyces sp. NPDC046197 TaxID=3154337 RepID=UPI0033EAA661
MRRTTLHRTTTVAAVAATLLLTGCGAQHDRGGSGSDGAKPSAPRPVTSPATPSPSASGPGSPSVSPSATPSAPTAPAGCADRSELRVADSGHTVCLHVGGQVRLTLDGTKDRPWSPVKASGTVLRAGNAGIVILPGDAVAAFDAVAPGTARLTSSRPLCPTRPGQVACKGIQEWTVTVRVTRP